MHQSVPALKPAAAWQKAVFFCQLPNHRHYRRQTRQSEDPQLKSVGGFGNRKYGGGMKRIEERELIVMGNTSKPLISVFGVFIRLVSPHV